MSDEDFVPFEQAGLEPIGSFIPALLRVIEGRMRISDATESPIETILGQALIEAVSTMFPAGDVTVVPQFVWRRYRIDWAVLIAGAPVLFVECDGQEYHSSEDARRRDAARDAECWSAGIEVARFTGSQIHYASRPCADKVVSRVAEIRGTHG
jgi:very-short-patch-repair endonuclease